MRERSSTKPVFPSPFPKEFPSGLNLKGTRPQGQANTHDSHARESRRILVYMSRVSMSSKA